VNNSTAVPNPTGGADGRRCVTQPALHDNLMQAALAPENMQRAWKQVKSIITGVSSKSYWHLARTPATQQRMSNAWLKAQGLISIRDQWMKAQGYR
jgi:hypothetical protein